MVLLNRRCARIRFDVQRFLSVAMLGLVHASVEAKVDPVLEGNKLTIIIIIYYYYDDMYVVVVIILIYYYFYYYFIEFVVVADNGSVVTTKKVVCTTMGRREVVNRTQSLPSQA